jgi:zinc protease
MSRPFVSLLLMASVVSLTAAKSAPATAVSAAPTLPSNRAEVFTLPNGLTIIVDVDRSAPVASVQAWCQTGSIHEGKWLGAGMSHILEHMLFKGTDTRSRADIDKRIQDLGGYINAYTAFDRTVFWVDIPADGAAEAVGILADVMMNATLPPDEYTKEQEVIRREFAMFFDDPDRQSKLLMFETVFSESPYRHPAIGYLDVYNKLTRDDVMEYYKARYTPNNLFFVITGDVDAEKIRGQLTAFFEKFPRRPIEPVFVQKEPVQTGRRDIHQEFPTELTRVNFAWPIPPVTHPDMPALDVLGGVLGGGASSPLYQEIREKKALAHSIGSGSFALADGGIFAIMAVCDPAQREAVEKESLAILEKLKRDGVTDADVEKAKRSLLAAQLDALTTARGKASDHGSNWLLTRNLNFSKDYLEAINRVTADDVRRVARQYLDPNTVNATSLNPIGSLAKQEKADDEARELEVQKFDLPNGIRLLVRENPRLPLVSMIVTFKGGVLVESAATNGLSRLFASTLLKGTKSRSAERIATDIESVGGAIGSDSGNNSFNVTVNVMKPDLKLGVELLADVVRNPTFPDAEVEREKTAVLAGIKADDDEITSVARNALRETVFGSHPYALRTLGSADAIPKLSAKDLRQFHDKFVCGKNCVISVFGDVNADEVLRLVEQSFGTLKAGEPVLAEPSKPEPLPEDKTVTAERNKQQAVLMVGYPSIDLFSPDRAVMDVIDSASSDLSSRFADRIREKNSLAYFVGSTQLLGIAPGMFVFYLGTDPAKLDRARAEMRDEISKLAAEGLTPEELNRAKQKLLGSEAIRDQSDSTMAQIVALDELYGLGADNHKKRRAEIEAVTVEDTLRVAQKYLAKPGVESIVAPPARPAAAAGN